MSIEIEYQNRTNGQGHWFDEKTMRFFRSRVLCSTIKRKGDMILFVSSEKFDDHSPRLYTVRKMDEKGDIETIGKFNELSKYQAIKLLDETYNNLN